MRKNLSNILVGALAASLSTTPALAGWEIRDPIIIEGEGFGGLINDAGEIGGTHPTQARTINANTGEVTVYAEPVRREGSVVSTKAFNEVVYYIYTALSQEVEWGAGKYFIVRNYQTIELEKPTLDCDGPVHPDFIHMGVHDVSSRGMVGHFENDFNSLTICYEATFWDFEGNITSIFYSGRGPGPANVLILLRQG